jgi:hypothetical protein
MVFFHADVFTRQQVIVHDAVVNQILHLMIKHKMPPKSTTKIAVAGAVGAAVAVGVEARTVT